MAWKPGRAEAAGNARERPVRPWIVLAIGGGIFAIVLAVAFYYSPMHFGLDRMRARAEFDDGVSHAQANRLDQAIEHYNSALALNPDMVEAYNNRGTARRRKGDLDGAIADYGEVIRLRPDNEAGYFNRALTWQQKGDLEAALADFTAAIRHGEAQLAELERRATAGEQGPNRSPRPGEPSPIGRARRDLFDAYMSRARLLTEKGDYAQAIAGFEAAGMLGPYGFQTEADFEHARVRLLQGDFARAAAEFEKLVGDAGHRSGALMYRGFLALFHANDPAAAAEDFAAALREGFQYRRWRFLIDGLRGTWLSNGVPFASNVHHLIVWQHVARQRAGHDDREELSKNLDEAARGLGHGDLLGIVSREAMADSRAAWPGRVIDMFLGTWTPEALRAAAEESTDPTVRRRQICDVDFYTGLFRLKAAMAEARTLLQRAADNCPPGALAGLAARLEAGRFGS
jgi:tetratricopeptide (TPR) repeat protein